MKRKARRVYNITGRAKQICAVEDELEVTSNFKESTDILKPNHNALVISFGIANYVIKWIQVDNKLLVHIIYTDPLKEMQIE